MKCGISKEEWWPVLELLEDDTSFDVPEEKLAEWKRIFDEFNKMQKEMWDVFKPELKKRDDT